MQLRNVLWDEIFPAIEAIEKDKKLYQGTNFILRIQAIDDLEFHIIDRLTALSDDSRFPNPTKLLLQYACSVKCELDLANKKMFRQLRAKLALSDSKGQLLRSLIDKYLDYNQTELFQHEAVGYDNLDIFINGLLTDHGLPVETKDREPEMVFYQKTPARVIVELVEKASFKPTDVFFDLGSGLGQVNILVNLLTAVPSKGVEIEPAFCNYAQACAAELNVDFVEFINTDARCADYSKGTVFFMYTPFEGKMLRDVLLKLKAEATKRTIKIFTYGPCTSKVAAESWLINKCNVHTCPGNLGEFISE